MEILDPRKTLSQLRRHLSDKICSKVVVVGSLAAAYHHWPKLKRRALSTKDADFLIHSPGDAGSLMEEFLRAGWSRSSQPGKECFAKPPATAPHECRAIRMVPPDTSDFFVELLGFPAKSQRESLLWKVVDLEDGRYGLPSFRFLGLGAEGAVATRYGLRCAEPSMMALANLLHHPTLGTQRIGNTGELRAAKDLGRVLALWFLEVQDGRAAWGSIWRAGLKARFPRRWKSLAKRVGLGLQALLQDESALREAHDLALRGLLAGYPLEVDTFRVLAQEILDGPAQKVQ